MKWAFRFVSDTGDSIAARPDFYRNFLLLATFAFFAMTFANIAMQFDAILIADNTDLAAKPRAPFVVFFDSPKIAVGQPLSKSQVVSHLRNTGYSETKDANSEFSPGSFCSIGDNALRLRSNHEEVFPDLQIEWNKNKISRIVARGSEIQSSELEARPINTLVSSQHNEQGSDVIRNTKVILIPARNHELRGTLTETVFLTAEGAVNPPVSVKAFLRAGYQNYISKPLKKFFGMEPGKQQGGSSPAMQIVKNAVTHDTRESFLRKISEVYIATELSRRMSEDDLFEVWANHIPFGVSKSRQNLYGVKTGAREILGKDSKDLDLSEATFLASLIPSPYLVEKIWAKRDDARAWKIVRTRQASMLDRLLLQYPDRFSAEEIDVAKKKTIRFAWDSKKYKPVGYTQLTAPFMKLAEREFRPMVEKQDPDEMAVPLKDLKHIRIRTRLNEPLMIAAQKYLAAQLPGIQKRFPPIDLKGKPADDSLVGVISMADNDTGEILTLVAASTNPKLEMSSAFATHGIAPCSQKKPFDYACALEMGKINLLTDIDPREGKILLKNGKFWQPSAGVGDAPKTVGECFTGSDDGCVAYIVGNQIGLAGSAEFYGKATGNYARPLISPSGEEEFPAINSIGFGSGLETSALEFNSAYSIFPREGYKTAPRFLSAIFRNGEQVSFSPAPEERQQIVSAETAYQVFWIMRGVMGVGLFGSHGTARNLKFSKYLQQHPEVWVGCKTGSGQHNVGMTCVAPRFTITAQLFYPKHSRFRQVGDADIYAASTAGAILSDFLLYALKVTPELFKGDVRPPVGIVEVKVDLQRKCRSETATPVPFRIGKEPGACPEPVERPKFPNKLERPDPNDEEY